MTDYAGVTALQQKMWATGDFHRIGAGQIIVGERLVRALKVHSGERVLDVAGGAGNTALAAARRFADVTCTDYVPELLVHATARAEAEHVPLRTEVADAQDLPYPDGFFDVVTSTFGVMFAPDQTRTASELLRVLRPGGRVGLANWTPQGWIGSTFRLAAEFRPLPAGVAPPISWGTRERIEELLGAATESLDVRERWHDFVFHSATALFDLFLEYFGPTATLWPLLDHDQRESFRSKWITLAEELNTATDGTLCVPSSYLQVVAVKK
ncbi:MAG: methyltransferase domain-containing protein [Actinomycetota bacterium]|nr:methyltransferase domain-containing protein [Actinomycetota bacterium]